MFYLKYRPQKFSQLFGLENVAEVLRKAVHKNKVGHAYLFHGPRGTGKTTTARLLAKAVNCKNPGTGEDNYGEPCGECESCIAIQEGRNLDLIELDAASNRGIDDIRSLRDKVGLSPNISEYKVYVIDEVHMLTREAFNALLKTLEEPPKHAIFVLCTTEPHRVPKTIHSRCQIFEFSRAGINDIVNKLQFICKQEEYNLSKGELQKIARAAKGGYRDAETLLEKVVVSGISVEDLISDQGDAAIFTQLLMEGNKEGALHYLNQIVESGGNVSVFAENLIIYLRDLLLIQAGAGEELVEAGQEDYQKMVAQATNLERKHLLEFINLLVDALGEMRYAVIPQLPIEIAIIELDLNPAAELSEPAVNEASKSYKKDSAKTSSKTAVKNKKENQDNELIPQWSQILEKIRPLNHSIEALLRSAQPKKLEEKTLVLEVFYRFHKDQLELSRNRTIIEKVVAEVFGSPRKVKCVLSKKPKKKKADDKKKIKALEIEEKNREKGSTENKSATKPADVFNGDPLLD